MFFLQTVFISLMTSHVPMGLGSRLLALTGFVVMRAGVTRSGCNREIERAAAGDKTDEARTEPACGRKLTPHSKPLRRLR